MYQVAIVTRDVDGTFAHSLLDLPVTGAFTPPDTALGWALIPAGEPATVSSQVVVATECLWQHVAIVAAAKCARRINTPRALRGIAGWYVNYGGRPAGLCALTDAQLVAANARLRPARTGSAYAGYALLNAERGAVGLGANGSTALLSLFVGAGVACAADGRVNTGLVLRKLVEHPAGNPVFALEALAAPETR